MRAAALALLATLGGCAARDQAPVPVPIAATAPAAATPAVSPRFDYEGELTQGGWLKGIAPAGTTALTLDGAPVPLAADRRFLVAFDRDAGSAAKLVARLGNGEVSLPLGIAPRAWEIERIATPARPAAIPSEEFRRRRAGELARIGAARARDTGAQGWRQRFLWPATGRISGRFGAQRIYAGEPGTYHSGIDIAPGGSGASFLAPADGVVILAAASPFTLEGKLLMVDHGAGLNSAFLHCSELLVREGEQVRQGQPLGRIGMTGRATGPHLHWSLKWREARLDPILFAGPMS